METFVCIKCLLANALLAALTPSLLISPVKLACLLLWVYIGLYCVQRVKFGSLVPHSRKSLVSFAALFAGPIVMVVLFVINTTKNASELKGTMLETLKKKLQNFSWRLRYSGLALPRNDWLIKMLDSSGKELKDIYLQGKLRRKDSRILDLTKEIILDAIEQRASDILIDPKAESVYTLRFRVDGVLRTIEEINHDTCKPIINSIKAVSGMDIAEKRRPQDGSFVAKTPDSTTSFRVASAGVLNGEKLSIRVLNQNAGMFTLNNIGLSEKQRALLQAAIAKPAGMILICGPTGSGKTTTLYAMLNHIDRFTRNLITIEDPIEYVLPHASQIEVNPKADITFANSLRSILRQDPDVICVGEIRDNETAEMALQASQTGHLVLATIHSNSNASALIRLLDLGVTPLLLSSGLSVIISQRLFRRLCDSCKTRATLTQSQIHNFRKKRINYTSFYQARGCDTCSDAGYYGRTAVFDILALDNTLKVSIANNTLSTEQLRKEGDKRGKSNMQKQGIRKVASGITSLEELNRVLG